MFTEIVGTAIINQMATVISTPVNISPSNFLEIPAWATIALNSIQ
jgi:hypothetical protein